MDQRDYVWGNWTDSNGSVHSVKYKRTWGEHGFTEKEQMDLLSGQEISFKHKEGVVTGHLQYYTFMDKQCFGFIPNFDKNKYDPKPVYRGSTFEIDLKIENDIMAEYMRLNYYAKLWNTDNSRVTDYRRITDIEEQKKGIDVVYTQNGKMFRVDEKTQMDYIYCKNPLPTFSLEILNGASNKIGWFVNDELKTEYYMFIWPHANSKPLSVNSIEYAYYALVNKKKLQIEVEKRYKKNKSQLLEYARCMTREKMGEEDIDKENGKCKGYRYKGDGFDDNGYLYYTLSKAERPVNLVVRRRWLEEISDTHGEIPNNK